MQSSMNCDWEVRGNRDVRCRRGTNLGHVHLQPLESLVQVDLAYRRLPCLGEGKVSQEDGCVKCEGIHIFRARSIDLFDAKIVL